MLKEVDTSGWDASLEPVGADVFTGNEHVETSVSMDLLDTPTSEDQLINAEELSYELNMVETPTRVTVPPGYHSQEVRDVIQKSVTLLNTLDTIAQSIVWNHIFYIYSNGRDYCNVPMNYWGNE